MKACLYCNQRFDAEGWRCPSCGREPASRGFLLFAPELADSNDGFEPTAFERLARTEPTSFWFRARNRLIVQIIKRDFPQAHNLLEIGCGTGYVLLGVRQGLPGLHVAGSELSVAGLELAARRVPGADLYQMDARHIPFDSEFDVVCAFDVLEHVVEDHAALAEMFKAVRPGGGIIVSVPQHPWLWSAGDDFAHHKRRYRRGELKSKLAAAGFSLVRITSFVSILLPLMALSRAFQRDARTYDPKTEYRAPPVLDRAMELTLETERWLIGRGVSLPAGGSVVAVARRPG